MSVETLVKQIAELPEADRGELFDRLEGFYGPRKIRWNAHKNGTREDADGTQNEDAGGSRMAS